jgi:hypothetical protein
MFGAPPPPGTTQPLWPAIEDGRHGYVEGLSNLPSVAGMGQSGFDDLLARMPPEKRVGPGFRNESWDGKHPRHVWQSLDILHDQCIGEFTCRGGLIHGCRPACSTRSDAVSSPHSSLPALECTWPAAPAWRAIVPAMSAHRPARVCLPCWSPVPASGAAGHCECLPDRDIPTKYYSIHFSCIHHVAKPSGYTTDEAFQTAVYSYALSCTRVGDSATALKAEGDTS